MFNQNHQPCIRPTTGAVLYVTGALVYATGAVLYATGALLYATGAVLYATGAVLDVTELRGLEFHFGDLNFTSWT